MHLSTVASVLAFGASAYAFSDSSPFVLVSTAGFTTPSATEQLQTGAQVVKSAKSILESCPTERYLLVSQPNAHAADLSGPNGCTVPNLCRAISDEKVRGKFSVAEVVGEVAIDSLADYIKAACSAVGKVVKVEETKLAPLSLKQRRITLEENDHILGESLRSLESSDSYSLVYLSSSSEPTYEAQFEEPLHMELKKRMLVNHARQASNETDFDNLPLFEKYQFFTPGIFMGLLAISIMLSILFVGIRALGSLEVSYGAFEKDMGPAAHKKTM